MFFSFYNSEPRDQVDVSIPYNRKNAKSRNKKNRVFCEQSQRKIVKVRLVFLLEKNLMKFLI